MGYTIFIDYIKKYRRKIFHEETQLPFPATKEQAEYTIESLAFRTGEGLRLAVRIFTPCCLALFALSFFWNPYKIVRSCSIAGLIGFGTNWIAIKKLFWPRHPRPIFGHGLIPSQRDDLIDKITYEVSEKLINEELIRQKIENSGILQRITLSLNEKLKELTSDKEFQDDTKKLLASYIKKISEDAEFREQIKSIAVSKLETVVGKVFKRKLFFESQRCMENSFWRF